jgi:capsular polysaccharide export protein
MNDRFHKKNKILVYADEIGKVKFFNRFYEAFSQYGYDILLITNRISIPLMTGWKISINVIKRSESIPVKSIPLTREIKDGSLSEDEAKKLYWATYNTAVSEYNRQKIECVFIFGGLNTPECAMRQFSEDYHIKTLYFELSNIPGKIFVDPQGTNYNSFLSKQISELDKYKCDEDDYRIWKLNYFTYKEINPQVPQSQKKNSINLLYLIDHLGFLFWKIPYENNKSLWEKIKNKIFWKSPNVRADNYDLQSGKYIYFPMQVSNDAQILFHSDINNIEGIEYASKIANENNLDLIVKIHPAENDPLEVTKIRDLQNSIKYKIVDYPSSVIIQYCHSVISINSTVGLEALIMDKDVTFLGRTIYKKFNKKHMMNYLMKYLIEIDYFGSAPITISATEELLKRMSISSKHRYD